MNLKNPSIITVYFLLLNCLFLQAESDSKKREFKIGLNSNYILSNSDFEGGHTGIGIFFEPYFSQNFSLVFSYNTFKLAEKSNGPYKYEPLKTRETYILLRYRQPIYYVVVYPEFGLGTWGSHASYYAFGMGMDIPLTKKIYISSSFNYLFVGHRLLDPGGSGWSSNLVKIYFNISYQFSL